MSEHKEIVSKCPHCGYDGKYKPKEGEPEVKGKFYSFDAHNVTDEPMCRDTGWSYTKQKEGIKGCPKCGILFLDFIDKGI